MRPKARDAKRLQAGRSACGFLCAHPACRPVVETDPHRAWREFPQITGLPRVNSQIKLQPCPVDFTREHRIQIVKYTNTKRPGTPARCEKRIWEGLDQNRQHLGFAAVGVQIRHDEQCNNAGGCALNLFDDHSTLQARSESWRIRSGLGWWVSR